MEEHIMYDVNSKCADDFINHEEILETLAYADENKNNKELIFKKGLISQRSFCSVSLSG